MLYVPAALALHQRPGIPGFAVHLEPDGAIEQPAVDVFPAGIPSLPERTLCAAHIKGGSRTGDFVSGVRGDGAGTKCGGTGI